MSSDARVRRSVVAGTFYPSDSAKLRRDVDAMLADARPEPVAGRPLVLIQPHAGYIYSGRVAAHGYSLLTRSGIDTVFVISPSHTEYFPFVSVFDGDAYETPLGKIPVDPVLAQQLVSADPQLKRSSAGHVGRSSSAGEHALEVQLPFLQIVLDNFRVIPVVMGDQSWDACRVLGDALGPFLKRDNIIVIASSDLSHFYPYDMARKLDHEFLNHVMEMDPWRLYESIKNKECEACGAGPVIAAMIAAHHVEKPRCRVLNTANSGDITGDHDRVVGYASVAIYAENARARALAKEFSAEAIPLTALEKSGLLDAARIAIENALGADRREAPVIRTETACGVFVTLHLRGHLRGCVGTTQLRKPLDQTIGEVAVAAATTDPRFPALKIEEVRDLHIEISLLSPLRRIHSPHDVEIGRHGTVVRNSGRSGLLLPQVAADRGWNSTELLERTCEKASLARDAWKDAATLIYVFTATVFGETKEIKH
jgi:hypothetical protein